MKNEFKPNEIWIAKFPEKQGHCIQETRPCIIINCFGDTVTVIPLTCYKNNKGHPNDLLIHKNTTNNLIKDSIAKLTQIHTLDKKHFIKKTGIIDSETSNIIKKIVEQIIFSN